MILHSLQCSRQKLQSHYSFVSILHSSFIIYQHLSFQPPKCNQCPLLPNFTAATFFQDTTTISYLWITTITASSLLKLLLLLPLSNLPHSRSYLYSFKPFSLLKVLKYNIHTVKSFKNRNYFISLPLLKIIWMFSIALRKKKSNSLTWYIRPFNNLLFFYSPISSISLPLTTIFQPHKFSFNSLIPLGIVFASRPVHIRSPFAWMISPSCLNSHSSSLCLIGTSSDRHSTVILAKQHLPSPLSL